MPRGEAAYAIHQLCNSASFTLGGPACVGRVAEPAAEITAGKTDKNAGRARQKPLSLPRFKYLANAEERVLGLAWDFSALLVKVWHGETQDINCGVGQSQIQGVTLDGRTTNTALHHCRLPSVTLALRTGSGQERRPRQSLFFVTDRRRIGHMPNPAALGHSRNASRRSPNPAPSHAAQSRLW